MNGKLARIEQQEAAEKLKDDTKKSKVINNTTDKKKKKKKKKEQKCTSSDETLEGDNWSDKQEVKERKRKKHKSKKIDDQELNEENYIMNKETTESTEENDFRKYDELSLNYEDCDKSTPNLEGIDCNGDISRTDIQSNIKKSKKKKRKRGKEDKQEAELDGNGKKKGKFCDNAGSMLVEQPQLIEKPKKKKSKSSDIHS